MRYFSLPSCAFVAFLRVECDSMMDTSACMDTVWENVRNLREPQQRNGEFHLVATIFLLSTHIRFTCTCARTFLFRNGTTYTCTLWLGEELLLLLSPWSQRTICTIILCCYDMLHVCMQEVQYARNTNVYQSVLMQTLQSNNEVCN